jgi:hypothetical protein
MFDQAHLLVSEDRHARLEDGFVETRGNPKEVVDHGAMVWTSIEFTGSIFAES